MERQRAIDETLKGIGFKEEFRRILDHIYYKTPSFLVLVEGELTTKFKNLISLILLNLAMETHSQIRFKKFM